jgi:hypothetical protein
MPVYTLTLPDWRPPSKNELFRGTLRERMRLQEKAAELVGNYAHVQGIPKATGPRKVNVRFTYPRGARFHDADAFYPSLLDCLVACHLLVDDSPKWVRIGLWAFQEGHSQQTVIRLRDLEVRP